jgi:hypothetical protein
MATVTSAVPRAPHAPGREVDAPDSSPWPAVSRRVFRRPAHTLLRGMVLLHGEGKWAEFRIPPALLRTLEPGA